MFLQRFVRFSTPCPLCGVEGRVVQEQKKKYRTGDEIETTRCMACGRNLYTNPVESSGTIAASVEQTQQVVFVEIPEVRAIPEERLIREVLIAAMMVRYRLGVCIASEGGAQGIVRTAVGKEWVEINNHDESLGLIVGDSSAPPPLFGCLFAFYADILANLFVRELVWKGQKLGCGSVMTTEPHRVLPLLHVALSRVTKQTNFAWAVFRKWAELRDDPFARRYLAGLSDEDIKEIFVQPPL